MEKLYRLSDGEATEFLGDDFEANTFTRLELVGNSLFVFSENRLRRYNTVTGELERTRGFTIEAFPRAAATKSSKDAVYFVRGADLWRADADGETRVDSLGGISRTPPTELH